MNNKKTPPGWGGPQYNLLPRASPDASTPGVRAGAHVCCHVGFVQRAGDFCKLALPRATTRDLRRLYCDPPPSGGVFCFVCFGLFFLFVLCVCYYFLLIYFWIISMLFFFLFLNFNYISIFLRYLFYLLGFPFLFVFVCIYFFWVFLGLGVFWGGWGGRWGPQYNLIRDLLAKFGQDLLGFERRSLGPAYL